MIFLFKNKVLDFIQPFSTTDGLFSTNLGSKNNGIIAVSYADAELYFVELVKTFLSNVLTIQFAFKCLFVLILLVSFIILFYILPLYLYRKFFRNIKIDSFYSFCRYNIVYTYVKYLNQQYVIEKLSGRFLFFYRFYFSIGIFIFVSTGSFVVLGSYFLFLFLNGFILLEGVIRKENSVFWVYFVKILSYDTCVKYLGNPWSSVAPGAVKLLPKFSKPMIKTGAKCLFFAGCAEHVYQDSKVLHTTSQLVSWKMECWAMGEKLPYNPEKFIPKDSVVTKLVDFCVVKKS